MLNSPTKYVDPTGYQQEDQKERQEEDADEICEPLEPYRNWVNCSDDDLSWDDCISEKNGIPMGSICLILPKSGGREGGLRETEEQREFRLAGDVEGYYRARAKAGDAYAARASMVVRNKCSSYDECLMASANFTLHATAFINRVDIDVRGVQIRLMNAHAVAVATDNLGVPGLLNPTQIAGYHHRVFTDLGLPKATFGGTPLTGMAWEANVWRKLPFLDWCKGCDTR